MGAIVIACILICSMSAVAYANTITTTMAGVNITASSSRNTSGGSAYTVYGNSGSVTVNASFSYKDAITGVYKGSESKNSSSVNVASVSFSAPTGCVSMSINASHSVSYQGQYWSGYTYE